MEADKTLKELFQAADINGDGVLTRDEIIAVVKKFSPGLTETQIDTWIQEGDLDGDGKINYDEFVNFYKTRTG